MFCKYLLVRRLLYSSPLHPRLDILPESQPMLIPASTANLVSNAPWLPQLSKSQTLEKATKIDRSPSKGKIHNCQYSDCNYSTDRRSNLNRHILAMHEKKLNRSSHYCCGIHFENKAKQRLHAKSVHSQGYKCPIRECGKRFQRKTLLDRHMATHDPSLRKHECNTCGYRTANKSNLNRHDEKHAK